jgi:hypothetical protein
MQEKVAVRIVFFISDDHYAPEPAEVRDVITLMIAFEQLLQHLLQNIEEKMK